MEDQKEEEKKKKNQNKQQHKEKQKCTKWGERVFLWCHSKIIIEVCKY